METARNSVMHIGEKNAVIFHTHYNFLSQLQRFLSTVFIWATIFTATFFKETFAVSCVVCKGLKLCLVLPSCFVFSCVIDSRFKCSNWFDNYHGLDQAIVVVIKQQTRQHTKKKAGMYFFFKKFDSLEPCEPCYAVIW